MKNYFFDKTFLTLDGLSLEQGITSHDCGEAMLTAAVMKQSSRNRVILSDTIKVWLKDFYLR